MSALLRVPAAAAAVAAAAACAAALPGFGARLDRFIAAIDLKRPLPMGFGLWLAIFPQAGDAQGIARCAAGSCRQHRQSGALQPAPRPSSTPHMTTMYGVRRAVPEQLIEPIAWTADRFALVLSHVGATHHQWVRPRP